MTVTIKLINTQDQTIRQMTSNELPALIEVSLLGAVANLGSRVRAEFPNNSDVTFRVYDLVGAVVKSQSLISTSNPGFIELDIAGLLVLGLGRAEVEVLPPVLPLPDELAADPEPASAKNESVEDTWYEDITPQPTFDLPPIPPPAAFDPLA